MDVEQVCSMNILDSSARTSGLQTVQNAASVFLLTHRSSNTLAVGAGRHHKILEMSSREFCVVVWGDVVQSRVMEWKDF